MLHTRTHSPGTGDRNFRRRTTVISSLSPPPHPSARVSRRARRRGVAKISVRLCVYGRSRRPHPLATHPRPGDKFRRAERPDRTDGGGGGVTSLRPGDPRRGRETFVVSPGATRNRRGKRANSGSHLNYKLPLECPSFHGFNAVPGIPGERERERESEKIII